MYALFFVFVATAVVRCSPCQVRFHAADVGGVHAASARGQRVHRHRPGHRLLALRGNGRGEGRGVFIDFFPFETEREGTRGRVILMLCMAVVV